MNKEVTIVKSGEGEKLSVLGAGVRFLLEAEKTADTFSLMEVELTLDDSGFVEFAVTGTTISGEFRCSDCGYGAVVQRTLPPCPMCGGKDRLHACLIATHSRFHRIRIHVAVSRYWVRRA